MYGPLPSPDCWRGLVSDRPVAVIYSASLTRALCPMPRAQVEVRALSPYQNRGLEGCVWRIVDVLENEQFATDRKVLSVCLVESRSRVMHKPSRHGFPLTTDRLANCIQHVNELVRRVEFSERCHGRQQLHLALGNFMNASKFMVVPELVPRRGSPIV
jgi:hypothetical protein